MAELRSQEGEREIVLVHVEVQAEPETDFGKRMFEYYALLWLHFDAPIVPVVLHLKRGDPKGIDIVEYRHALFEGSGYVSNMPAWDWHGFPRGSILKPVRSERPSRR